ncbi:MAG TPA: type II toxin-antitoxin system RelE/ParE family toxin [Abditibacteriaceae bacterium]
MGKSEKTPHDVKWSIQVTAQAQAMLESIKDMRVRKTLIDTIDGLAVSPDLKGKPLQGEFAGYRSVRSASQRYRIIYRLEETTVTVLIVAAGIRREGARSDIYHLAQRLLRLGLLEAPPQNDEENQSE